MPQKVKIPFDKTSHQDKLESLKYQNKNPDIDSQNQQIENSQNQNVVNSQNSSQATEFDSELDSQSNFDTNLTNPQDSQNSSENFPTNFDQNSSTNSHNSTNNSMQTNNLPTNPQDQAKSDNFNNQNPNSNSNSSEIQELQKQIIELKKNNEEMTNRAFRMAADAQNASKQEEINLAQARKQTKKSIVNLIMPFLDALYLSFDFVPETSDEKIQKFVQTLRTSFEKMINDLKLSGIELIIPLPGDDFDPQIMMPLNPPEENENSSNSQEVKIKKVVSLGLKIDGQVVRSSYVML